jgi:hypothetical protein
VELELSHEKGGLTVPSHVFISYVRENAAIIDRLREDLILHQIKIWVDRYAVDPGARWKLATRRAIQEADFFLACFSAHYYRRNDTWMNEELQVAIEKLRQRHVDRTWFIPVKLSPCELPELEIDSRATLRDLQYVELYPDWHAGVERLAAVLAGQVGSLPAPPQPLPGDKTMNVKVDNLNAGTAKFTQGSEDGKGNVVVHVGNAEVEDFEINQK